MTTIEFIGGLDIKLKGVIQVGVNQGQEIKDYIDLDIRNMVLFEPIPSCVSQIETIIKKTPSIYYDTIYLVDKACGNFNGKSVLILANNSGMSSSLLKPKVHIEKYPNIRFTGEVEIEVVRLDDYVKDYSKNYDFLSIDVQGYELEVLKGATNMLENYIKVIQAEVNSVELYEGGVLIDDLDSYLKRFGFERVFCTRDVDEMKEKEKWADAVYIKED